MVQLKPQVVIAILAAGALLALVGMLDWVGYLSWGISPYALYIGAAMTIIGVVLAHIDLHLHKEIFDEYESVTELRENMGGFPDDDYCIDMTGGPKAEYDSEYCNLTIEGGIKK